MASTTTAYRLQDLQATAAPGSSTLRQTRAARHDESPLDPNADPVLEASRLADSTVPDGGRGWFVIAGCAIVAWWNIGISYTWGVYQGALVERGVGSALTMSFCGALPLALMAALATFNARAMRTFGIRPLALAGVACNALAQIGASFVTHSAVGLFFLPGLLMGIGMSACFMAFSVAPAHYFRRKRGLANGIIYAGGGLGGAVMSITANAMIENHGLEWAFRISGLALAATAGPAAWFIRERTPLQPSPAFDFSLLRQLPFAVLFLASALGVFPLLVPPFFVPLYAHSMGLSTGTGATLLAGFNFSSAVGRIISGHLCDVLGPINTLTAFLLINSLTMIALWPASTTLAPFAVFAVMNGLTNGGFFSSMPTVVGNLFGSVRVATAMSMMITGWIGGYLFGSPIAGFLLEAYGGAEGGLQAYRPAMFYAGFVSLAAALLVVWVRFRMSKRLFAKI